MLKLAFGDARDRRLAISSTKAVHGHAMGASAALEVIATILALGEGVIPPTANYTEPDPECDLDYVPTWRDRDRSTRRFPIRSRSAASTPSWRSGAWTRR